MTVIPKPYEVRQAQLAAFTAEQITHYYDREHIFRNFGHLALGDLYDISRTVQWKELCLDEKGVMTEVSQGTERTVATIQQYIGFLRKTGRSESDPVMGRATLLSTYHDKFKSAIDTLLEEIEELPVDFIHPAFLSQGSTSKTYLITHDDQEYVVRAPCSTSPLAGVIDDHIAGSLRVKGVPHLEQIVAASYDSGVTVAERVPGESMATLSREAIQGITSKQLDQLVKTVIVAHQRGVSIDPVPGNVLYDTHEGFGIVDYSSRGGRDPSYESSSLVASIRNLADIALASMESDHPFLAKRLENRLRQFVRGESGTTRSHVVVKKA